MEIPKLVTKLVEVQAAWNADVIIEAFGGFKGVPQSLRAINPKLRIEEITPQGDKLTRALPVAAAWNNGRVRVPKHAPWLNDFMYEVMSFTGTKEDVHDDQVDALAHAYNSLEDDIVSLRIAAARR
jgi:predicted phage terminase large subunit-like protein